MTAAGNNPMKVAGFVIESHSDRVIAYSLRFGYVRCPKVCFTKSAWMGSSPGEWLEIGVIRDREKEFSWTATSVRQFSGTPPIAVRIQNINSKFVAWTARSRAIVGLTFAGNYGTAWSPTVGLIHISRKHVDLLSCGQDVELEVCLRQQSDCKKEHWFSKEVVRCLNPDPSQFISSFSEVAVFNARISYIKNDVKGFFHQSLGRETGVFLHSSFCLSNGEPKLRELAKIGSEWQVLAFSQKETSQNYQWRAIAVLPVGSLVVPSKTDEFCHIQAKKKQPDVDPGAAGFIGRGKVNPAIQNNDEKEVPKNLDACSQTEDTEELKFIRSVFENRDLFAQICANPDMVRMMMSLNLRANTK